DNGMKTPDGSFKGFPAGWNMVVFGLMALSPSQGFTIGFVLFCCVLTFLPVKFVHPVRVQRWRVLTLIVTAIWFIAAGHAVVNGMQTPEVTGWVLTGASVYLFSVSAVQQVIDRYF
ncbi:MAG: phosphatidylcholine/phosphatidylserine synthase, partial [Nisaea sp.]